MNTVRVYEEFQFNKKALLRIITLLQAVFQMNGLGDWEWDIFSFFFKIRKKVGEGKRKNGEVTWESLKRSQLNSTNTFTLIPSHHHHCLGIYMLSCLLLSTDRLTTTTTIKTHMVIEPISPSLSSLASNTLFPCKAKQLMGIYQQEEKKMVSRQKMRGGSPFVTPIIPAHLCIHFLYVSTRS